MRHGGKIATGILLIFALQGGLARAEPAIEQVGTSLNALNQWLGDNENASRWKRFLRYDELVSELAKGATADRKRIQEIQSIYAGDTPGLEKSRFVAVRQALEAWLAQSPVSIDELAEAVRAERENFRVPAADRPQLQRRRLESAMADLDRFLSGSSAANAAAWKRYLKWEQLQQNLQNPDGVNAAELQAIADLYSANHRGLEFAHFADVRQALVDYSQAIYYSGERVQEAYVQQMDELGKRLEAYAANPNAEDGAAIGRIVGWLERGGQVPQVVASIRQHFQQPNLMATVSRRLIADAIETDEARLKMNQPQAIRDVILKTSIQGTAYPNLTMNLLLVPDPNRAIFDLRLLGAATSSNVGYRGPVTIYSTGYTSIHASKYVYLNELGFLTSAAGASCATSTNIYDIAASCGLIERIAWNQAGKSQGQAEAIASARAQGRIARQLDGEVGPRLAEANASYQERFRNRLLRRDSFPRTLQFSTTDDALHLRMIHATAGQMAASDEAPETDPSSDLSVRVHESLVINFGESLLGGVTLSDERLIELLEESKAEIPEELKITPDKDPWSITFTNEQPVTARFTGDEVRFAIRGRRFTRGDQEVRAIMEMSATYRLEKAGNGSKLTRQGDVAADYIGRDRQNISETAMKTVMRKKFEALFKPEIVSDGLALPEQFGEGEKLQLRDLKSNNGWLALSWLKAGTQTDAVAEAGGE